MSSALRTSHRASREIDLSAHALVWIQYRENLSRIRVKEAKKLWISDPDPQRVSFFNDLSLHIIVGMVIIFSCLFRLRDSVQALWLFLWSRLSEKRPGLGSLQPAQVLV